MKIQNIAKEDFFYGNDIPAFNFESGLSPFETQHSEILKKIIECRSLNSLTSDDKQLLHVLTLFQEARTKSSKMFACYFANYQFENGKITIDSFNKIPRKIGREIGHPIRTAFGQLMHAPILCYEGISDLRTALIVNLTNNDFICSDAPVVRFNQLKIGNNRQASLFSPGLEIFYPINKSLLLLFYDSNAYDVDFDFDTICYVNNPKDIDAINKLQFINALEFVAFSDIELEKNIRELNHDIQRLINRSLIHNFGSIEKGKKLFSNLDSNHWNIFCQLSKYYGYGLELSFTHIKNEYERLWQKKFDKLTKQGNNVELIRNEELKEKVETNLKNKAIR
jgi:hypothetical protein